MSISIKHLIWAFLAVSLAACGPLPRGAAIEQEILRNANEPASNIAIYPVTRAFLPSLTTWPRNGERSYSWIGHSHGPETQVIRPGDSLSLVIWDSGENSLLTGPEERVATMPAMRVSQNGMIFVPYVGKLKVSGQTPDGARGLIQRQLEAIVPSAQVQVNMAEGRGNSIDLVGGVNNPGNITMPDQDFSVLAAISAGGGVSAAMANPQVKLVRGHNIYATSVNRLYDNPSLDTRLLGGDRVIVEDDRRYFLSLGAAGSEAQFPFNRDDVSALDALAMIGGLNDARADPQGILILREYAPSAVKAGSRGPRKTRVVFTLDLTSSDGLFSARHFNIQSGDLVLATESPVTNAQTILSLVGSAFGVATASGLR